VFPDKKSVSEKISLARIFIKHKEVIMRLSFSLPILFLLICVHLSGSQVPEQDSLALIALYDSTNGANWTNDTNWKSSESISSW
jgi:hypothetical protein